MHFAIIVVNYRTPQLVIDCINSVVTQLVAGDQIIVVDNASADGSAIALNQAIDENGWGDRVQLVEASENRGFSAGNNLGIQTAGDGFGAYWLTNSDTLFRPDAVAVMRKEVQEDEHTGIFAPRLEWPDGRPQISTFRFHTPLGELLAGANTGPITNLFPDAVVPIPTDNDQEFPDWVSFASVVIRAEALAELGPLDEGYFMYFEDVDFCHRRCVCEDQEEVWLWEIIDYPECRVVHLRGGTSDVKERTAKLERRPTYYYAARSRYFAKHYGPVGLWWANSLWTFGRLIALGREVFGQKKPHVCEKEWLDIWTNAWCPLQKPGGQNG